MNKHRFFDKVNLYLVIILIAIVLLIYNGLFISKNNKKANQLRLNNEYMQRVVETYEYNFQISMHANSISINPDIDLIDINGHKRKLAEIIDSPKLVIRYSKLSCSSCVENEFILLKKLRRKIGLQNIIMITDYDDIGQLYRFQRINEVQDIKVYVCSYDELHLINELENIPYYFVLDSTMQMKSIFVPDKLNNQITEEYFRLVIASFFKVKA